MQLHAQEQSNIFYTFVCKNVSSCPLKFPEKYADKYVENLKQASGEISAQVRPQILCCVALVYNSYIFFCFFQNLRFTEIIWKIRFSYKHSRACLPVKIASKDRDKV